MNASTNAIAQSKFPPIHLVGVASAMPPDIIQNDFFGEALKTTKNRMFMGTQTRRHIDNQTKASDLIVQATRELYERLDLNLTEDLDIIITNVSVPDELFTGCGLVVKKKLGAGARWIIDLHNTGCISFVYMIELARSLMWAYGAKTALICNVQTAGGRIFSQPSIRKKALSAIPGDGCGVGLLMSDDRSPVKSPIISLVQQNHPTFAEDMYSYYEDGRKFWEASMAEGHIDFTDEKAAQITIRGNRIVPAVVREAAKQINIDTKKIDCLVTNQPNSFFLRNWREALQIPPENHLDTFSEYANLFGAAIPINLDVGIKAGRIKEDSLLCLAGFSHAGDYAAAAIIHWKMKCKTQNLI